MLTIPNTTTIKSMSIFNFLDQVDFNTDQNHHTENVVMIAKRFGSDQDIECAEYVLKRHEEETMYDRGFNNFKGICFR